MITFDETAPQNGLKHKLASGDVSLCMALRIVAVPDIVLIAKAAGFDALYVDLEHGSVAPDVLRNLAAAAIAASFPCLARVPSLADIPRILDAGISGVICPDIRTAEAARCVVAETKFPPLGKRGVSTAFPQFGYRPVPAVTSLPALNAASMVVVQIESAEGLENVESIAGVEGVDLLLIGSNDLLAALGHPGDYDHPALAEAYARTIDACATHGIACGIGGLTSRPDLVAHFTRMGAAFISAGNDVSYLVNGARASVERFSERT